MHVPDAVPQRAPQTPEALHACVLTDYAAEPARPRRMCTPQGGEVAGGLTLLACALQEFVPVARELEGNWTRFTPHYIVWVCPESLPPERRVPEPVHPQRPLLHPRPRRRPGGRILRAGHRAGALRRTRHSHISSHVCLFSFECLCAAVVRCSSPHAHYSGRTCGNQHRSAHMRKIRLWSEREELPCMVFSLLQGCHAW